MTPSSRPSTVLGTNGSSGPVWRVDAHGVAVGNALVSAVLRSPLHWLLSGSTDLIRYTGWRSGREMTTPTGRAAPWWSGVDPDARQRRR